MQVQTVQLLGHEAASSNERRPRHSGANDPFSQTYSLNVDGNIAISWPEEFQPQQRLLRNCLIYCSGLSLLGSRDPMLVYTALHRPFPTSPSSVHVTELLLGVEKYLRTLPCGDWTR